MTSVKLHDGREVDSESEDWRAECEARTVLSWPKWERQEFIADVEKKRGKPAADKLRGNIMTLWKQHQ